MSPAPRYDSEKVDASPLGQSLKFEFSGKTAKNRFLKAAMTERLSTWDLKDFEKRGIPTPELINVYKRWGEGGFGVILTGNQMIEFDHLEAAGNMIIPRKDGFSGERFEAFKELATQSKAQGCLIVGQLSHPGRQVEQRIQKDPVSASDVQLEGTKMGMQFNKPHAASEDEIKAIVDGFAHAAEYLDKAGYDGCQLHGAHGYLLSQFLSQTTNKRTDKYGGSLENRSRIIFEIAQEVKRRVSKDFILGIKLNSVEFQSGGFQPEDAKQLSAKLEEAEFDFLEFSGGTYEHLAFSKRESTKNREGFFLEFVEKMNPGLKKTKTYTTGGFKTVAAMVQALEVVDGVGLARPVCQEPHLPRDILSGKVTGAVKQRLDDDDFGLTNAAAGTQIRQIAFDRDPIDLSSEEKEKVFKEEMGKWAEKNSKDSEGEGYGYVRLEDLPSDSFGTTEVY